MSAPHFDPLQALFLACRRLRQSLTPHVLIVHIRQQRMWHFSSLHLHPSAFAPLDPSSEANSEIRPNPPYTLERSYRVSTSRFGIGQQAGSNRTPLGLHRIAQKIGAGCPAGAVFVSRQPIDPSAGIPDNAIVHRILWLEGLEPGFNSGPGVDTFQRYVYIHGTSREENLGRPASQGCIHLAAADLLPLFDRVPLKTLLWIDRG